MKLEELSNETLIELTKMYARNWQTLDSLWFRNVEQEYGLDTAVLLDLKNWERQSVIEAERIKEVLRLDNGGLPSVLTAISFMSWQLVSPPFRCEEESPQRVVFSYPRCPVQEGRVRQGKPEFPCKDMKLTLFSLVSRVIEPRAVVTCLACPPGMSPVALSPRGQDVVRSRQRKPTSWYLDLALLADYWTSERRYHHTAPVSMILALREGLRIVLEEGLEA
ncbi:MAG: DUF6125 family protein, partial [Dehalococcoidia bacterium]|nr:DUF6125 family protein [Dehalococcoidia bacterium]